MSDTPRDLHAPPLRGTIDDALAMLRPEQMQALAAIRRCAAECNGTLAAFWQDRAADFAALLARERAEHKRTMDALLASRCEIERLAQLNRRKARRGR